MQSRGPWDGGLDDMTEPCRSSPFVQCTKRSICFSSCFVSLVSGQQSSLSIPPPPPPHQRWKRVGSWNHSLYYQDKVAGTNKDYFLMFPNNEVIREERVVINNTSLPEKSFLQADFTRLSGKQGDPSTVNNFILKEVCNVFVL